MISESELGNILVQQKNRIVELIDNKKFLFAGVVLATVFEHWDTCGYAYKWFELIARVQSVNPFLKLSYEPPMLSFIRIFDFDAKGVKTTVVQQWRC